MRAPPMLCGLTTLSAPARRSFSSLSSMRARATMKMSGRSERALSVTKRFPASVSSAATNARARNKPAASRTRSSLASPTSVGTSASAIRLGSTSTTTRSAPAAVRSAPIARPTRPQPHTMTCPRIAPIRRSILRLPNSSERWPSRSISRTTLNVYNAVPTPTRMSAIVKTWPASSSGRTSRKPTVATVVTVWYTASSHENPSKT